MKFNLSGLIFLGISLAAGLTIGGYFIGQTMYNAKVALNTAEAKGLAERRVVANRANWELEFKVSSKNREEIPELYKKAEKIQQSIVKLLKKSLFDENEIQAGIIDYSYKEFRNSNKVLTDEKHILVGSISIDTDKVRQVAKVRASVNKLIAQGIDIENYAPSYRFTKLNDIKPEMLSEATKNARIAANEFAKNAGVKVGGIRSARQGSFRINDVGEDYGDTRKIEKTVRVVTTITFYLTD